MRFIDSNVFLRYMTQDDPRAQQACAELIARLVKGEEEVFTTDVHIHETAYVLASKALYGLSHQEIRARLRPLLLMTKLRLRNKRLCLDALDIFAANDFLDYADALAVAHMRRHGVTDIYSFDKDFTRVQAINRIEPPG